MPIDSPGQDKRLLYVINVDWYFVLHWLDRAKAAQKAGYEIHIATSLSDMAHRETILENGFCLHEIAFSRRSLNPLRELKCLFQLSRLTETLRPQLMHCITMRAAICGGTTARWRSIPCVASITGLGYAFSSTSRRYQPIWKALITLLRYALNHDRTVVVFEQRHDLEQLVSRKAIAGANAMVIPGAGVDLNRFSRVDEDCRSPCRVLFAGRLLQSKGLGRLVLAIRQLKETGMLIELHVAGIVDPESHDMIPQSVLQKWIDNQEFVWHGEVRNIENLIASVNLVCLPTSYGEGIPRILLEAAAVGRAIIASDVPGCRDFVTNNVDGFLVQINDTRELKRAISTLAYHSDSRLYLTNNARKKVEGRYSNTHVIEKTLELYKAMIEESRGVECMYPAIQKKTISISTVLHLTPLDYVKSHIDSLLKAAQTLEENGHYRIELYIIDNSTSDSYFAEIVRLNSHWNRSDLVNIEVIQAGENCGYGCGNNLILHLLKSEFHLVVNPDVAIEHTALLKAVQFMETHEDAQILTPLVLSDISNVNHVVKRYPDCLTLALRYIASDWLNKLFSQHINNYACTDLANQDQEIELVGGCFMFLRTNVLRQLGGFDQRYFMYFEDFDLCRRAHSHGKIYYVPGIEVRHHGGDVGRKGLKHHLYFARSALRFFNTYGWRLW